MLAQVFLKALASLGSCKWTGLPFQAWLFGIAHNLLVDALRRRSHRPTAPIGQAASLSGERRDVDPETVPAEKLMREGLRSAVDKLTELQKQVIALKFAAGLPNAEVARLMGKTEGR